MNSGYQARLQELKERETILMQREASLTARWQVLEEQALSAQQNRMAYPRNAQPIGQNNGSNPYRSLQERAREDGITMYTAGARPYVATQKESAPTPTSTSESKRFGTYNVGATLFKAAMLMLCIVASESILVFFLTNYMEVPVYYPAVGFALGFIAFLICSILYVANYKPNARRKKKPTYWLTSSVLSVIAVLIVTMIAVYLKVPLDNPVKLLSYVLVPVLYISNILIFTVFYHMFSLRNDNH